MSNNGNGKLLPLTQKKIDARLLIPSKENWELYRERPPDSSDWVRFKQSVGALGVQQAILCTRDRYIGSGHQRQRAAIETGKVEVPITVLNKLRTDYSDSEWASFLVELNTGREKTFDELVREKLVDINPAEAIQQIVDYQVKRTTGRMKVIEVSEKEMKRYKISPEKRGMADAVLVILRELEDYLPVSLRAIHYRLLTLDFWRNSKTQLPYKNDIPSYHDLSNLVTRMRKFGEISWDDVEDETRPMTTWNCWKDESDFIKEQCESFLKGYARDLLQSQEQFFVIVTEKLTVKNFVEKIAAKYCMPCMVIRGNSGITARWEIVKRFRQSGKSKLFLFCLGDCDPDGDNICESTMRSLRDDFVNLLGRKLRIGVDLDGVRVAMTHEQADEWNLPKTLDAMDKKSVNLKKFITKHGGRTDCYELDAPAPEVLQGCLDEAIRAFIDIEAYNHEVERQTKGATRILAGRKAMLDWAKWGLNDDEDGDD